LSLVEILAQQSLLQGLEPLFLAALAECARAIHVEEGEELPPGGCDALFFLRAGEVAVEVDEPGRGRMVVETLGRGEWFGSPWRTSPRPGAFTMRANAPCRILVLDGPSLRGRLSGDPALATELLWWVARDLEGRLEGARLQLLDIYGRARGAAG
jgi:CRP/FNR family cyclic AMP-dependent transcriptional regulator